MPDTGYTNTAQKVTPDGRVSYTFDGKIIASGGLDVGLWSGTETDSNRVRFLESVPDGVLAGAIGLTRTSLTSDMSMRVKRTGGRLSNAFARLQAEDENDPAVSLASLTAGFQTGGLPVNDRWFVDARANAITRRITDNAGRSDFMRSPTLAEWRLWPCYTQVAVPGGWSGQSVPWYAGAPPAGAGTGGTLRFYMVEAPNGASITGSHGFGYDPATGMTVALSSSVAQTVQIFGLVLTAN
jgi:hypothetical protein